jgi:hypothetical protein
MTVAMAFHICFGSQLQIPFVLPTVCSCDTITVSPTRLSSPRTHRLHCAYESPVRMCSTIPVPESVNNNYRQVSLEDASYRLSFRLCCRYWNRSEPLLLHWCASQPLTLYHQMSTYLEVCVCRHPAGLAALSYYPLTSTNSQIW